jgi:DNA/RNA endonuclease YhcR with UshA esterase domain
MLAGLTFAISLSAADTNAPASSKAGNATPMKIGTLDATNYYDQTMIVTGKVVQVTIRPSVTFLNLDKPFPNSPFAIVIIHGKSSYYGDANALKGKSVEIRGKIKNYKDKPEIVLDSTNQLTVFNFTNSVKLPDAPAVQPPAKVPAAVAATNDIPEIF